MPLNMRDSLLIQRCLNNLVQDYEFDLERDTINAEVNLQLSFIAFIRANNCEIVEYGITYLSLKYPEVYNYLKPVILEYHTNGVESFADPEEEENQFDVDVPQGSHILAIQFNKDTSKETPKTSNNKSVLSGIFNILEKLLGPKPNSNEILANPPYPLDDITPQEPSRESRWNF